MGVTRLPFTIKQYFSLCNYLYIPQALTDAWSPLGQKEMIISEIKTWREFNLHDSRSAFSMRNMLKRFTYFDNPFMIRNSFWYPWCHWYLLCPNSYESPFYITSHIHCIISHIHMNFALNAFGKACSFPVAQWIWYSIHLILFNMVPTKISFLR